MIARKPRARERGAAILIALGGLALVSALAAAALSLATGPATRASAAIERAAAIRVAEATVHRLAVAMSEQELRAAAPLDGTVISTDFLEATVTLAGQDVAGLIDLNAASSETLQRLFQAFAPEDAGEIADALIDARSAGNGRPGFPSLTAALTALPEALRPLAEPAMAHATVHSGREQVDPSTATAPALAAATGLPLETAQAFVSERLLNGRRAALPPDTDLAALTTSNRNTVRITVRSETAGGGRAVVTAVLRSTPSPRAPVQILSWR